MIKRILTAVLILFSFLIIYLFLYGILFPWSPLKIGFKKIEYKRSTIFYPLNTNIDSSYSLVDSLMEETEQFHRLKYRKKVKVIICKTKSQYHRFSTQKSPLCTMFTGTVIYVNPTVKETKRDLKSFLKHELSHAVLFQNSTILKSSKMKRWLIEGLAVFYGNPHHYFQNEKFLELALDKKYLFNLIEGNKSIKNIPGKIRYLFEYAEYRYFIEYLFSNFGEDLFFDFIKQYISAPDNLEKIFKKIYKAELNEVFQSFMFQVKRRQFP